MGWRLYAAAWTKLCCSNEDLKITKAPQNKDWVYFLFIPHALLGWLHIIFILELKLKKDLLCEWLQLCFRRKREMAEPRIALEPLAATWHRSARVSYTDKPEISKQQRIL